MSFRFVFKLLITVGAVAFFSASSQAEEKIKVGVTSGPHAQILEVVKKAAAKEGLVIQSVEFSDFVQPNAALAAGELNANSYQHLPYLEAQMKDRGYQLVNVGYTVTFPMGVYSKRIKSLAELKPGARIAIPNDPTNGARALLLLKQEGLLKLRVEAGLQVTVLDIVDNPKKLKMIELDAAQLPRVLNDVDAAAINTDFAVQAQLVPTRDALALEPAQGPYANLIAIRAVDRNQPWVAKLVSAYHSPDVKKYITEQFKGAAIAAW